MPVSVLAKGQRLVGVALAIADATGGAAPPQWASARAVCAAQAGAVAGGLTHGTAMLRSVAFASAFGGKHQAGAGALVAVAAPVVLPALTAGSYAPLAAGALPDNADPAGSLLGTASGLATATVKIQAAGALTSAAVLAGHQPGDLVAQALFDFVDWYPGCGDAFNFGSTQTSSPTIQLAGAKILRGQAWGLILEADHTPANGETATVTDTDISVAAGSGTSNAIGEYLSGSPYGRGQHNQKISVGSGNNADAIGVLFHARKKHQAAFVIGSQASGVTVVSHRWGYHVGWIDQSGSLKTQRCWHSNQQLDPATVVTIDQHTDCAEPHLAIDLQTGILSMLWHRGDGSTDKPHVAWRAFSLDYGLTWVYDPDSDHPFRTTAMGITHSREVNLPHGGIRLYAYNDGSGGSGTGLIQVDVIDGQGMYQGTFPAGGGGIGGLTADDTSFDLTLLNDGTNGVDIVFVTSGNRKVFRSLEDGVSWVDVT